MWLIRVKPALYLSMLSKIVLFSSETASISSLSSTVEEGLVSFWTPLRLKLNLGEVESANLDLLERIEVLRRSGELRIEWFLESAREMILPLIRGEGAWIHFSRSGLSRSFGLIFFTLNRFLWKGLERKEIKKSYSSWKRFIFSWAEER